MSEWIVTHQTLFFLILFFNEIYQMSSFSKTFRRGGDGPGAIFGGLVIFAFVKASQSKSKSEDNRDSVFHGGSTADGDTNSLPHSSTRASAVSGRLPNAIVHLWSNSSWYHIGGAMACVWMYKCKHRFHMLMTIRYSDICYQLRRPDVLANKVVFHFTYSDYYWFCVDHTCMVIMICTFFTQCHSHWTKFGTPLIRSCHYLYMM